MYEQSELKESDHKNRLDKLTRKATLVMALCSSPLFFIFAYLGDPAKGRAASVCAFVVIAAVRVYWDLRTRVSFWLALAVIVILHIPLIMYVPWTNKNYPGVVILPTALLDFGIVYGVFKLVGGWPTQRSFR